MNYTPGVTADDTLGGTYGVSPACIYTNKANKKYFITASSTNSFKVKQGTKTIDYVLSWHNDDKTAATAGLVLTHATKSAEQTLAATPTVNCNAGANDNAGIKIKFTKADLDAADSGAYTDTLTLLVTPN